MPKVKVIEAFRDREAELLLRKKDEVLEVSDERAKKLKGLGLAEDYVEEPDGEPTEEPKPKKQTRKK